MLTDKDIIKYLNEPIAVSVFEKLESTNTTAKEMARSGKEHIIIARSQSGGRGRLGRSFFSPDSGLYMSLLFYPSPEICDASLITSAAAVAVARAIDRIANVRCQIKWVNDIYLAGKKVCGILTEGQLCPSGGFEYAVLGIGINLTAPKDGFPEEIADRAGAVFEVLPSNADNILAATVINEFMSLYKNGLKRQGFLDEYRTRSCVIGRVVNVMHVVDGESIQAEAIGIDNDCRLIVRYSDGTSESLVSGDVTLKGI